MGFFAKRRQGKYFILDEDKRAQPFLIEKVNTAAISSRRNKKDVWLLLHEETRRMGGFYFT